MSPELAQGEERQYLRHVSSRSKTGHAGDKAKIGANDPKQARGQRWLSDLISRGRVKAAYLIGLAGSQARMPQSIPLKAKQEQVIALYLALAPCSVLENPSLGLNRVLRGEQRTNCGDGE